MPSTITQTFPWLGQLYHWKYYHIRLTYKVTLYSNATGQKILPHMTLYNPLWGTSACFGPILSHKHIICNQVLNSLKNTDFFVVGKKQLTLGRTPIIRKKLNKTWNVEIFNLKLLMKQTLVTVHKKMGRIQSWVNFIPIK